MPAKRPLKVPAAVWRIASTFLNPENLIAVWEHLNKDDRVLEFFRSIHPSKGSVLSRASKHSSMP